MDPFIYRIILIFSVCINLTLLIQLYNQNKTKVITIDNTLPTDQKETKSYSSDILKDGFTNLCEDPIWCHVPMPNSSYFNFDPPTNIQKWKQAQTSAAQGKQVFLERIREHSLHPLDFLDGDKSFRKINSLVDIFIDSKKQLSSLSYLVKGNENGKVKIISNGRNDDEDDKKHKKKGDEGSGGYINAAKYLPPLYDFRAAQRSPVIQLGYGVFKKSGGTYFAGSHLGYNGIKLEDFLFHWNKIKDKIDTPFIALCQGNENWGCLSTMFPNRTAKWGSCCSQPRYKLLEDFLNHEKTLAFIVNQHHNLTHPKVMVLPRGIPIQWVHTESLILDSMRYAVENVKKSELLFASGSSWGPRPQILKCLSNSLSPEDFTGHIHRKPDPKAEEMKTDRRLYYRKLASARFGLAMPGLGYDCFRTWELLTMGTVVVLERGIGLDRTLHRLPALLVDDFAEITPELLRQAYVEAVYRVDEFEFQRLKQTYWWEIISQVARNRTTAKLLDYLPMEAQDITFSRPKEPFTCAFTGSCGLGTKRTPRKSC